MRTPADLRSAYEHLAHIAPSADDLQLDLTTTAQPHRRRTGVTVAVIAVAAVVAAILVTIGITINRHNSQPAGTVVTCSSPTGDPSAAAKDGPVIQSRLTTLGLHATVRSTSGGTAVTITPKGRTHLDAATLCTNATLRARPILSVGQGSCSGTTNDLQKSLVVCADQLRLEVGAAIFTEQDIDSVQAVQPNPAAGMTEWTVSMQLNPRGRQAWAAYTSAHNVGSHEPPKDITTCAPTTTPCRDFVAFVINGKVVSIPVTLAPITGGATELAGGGTNGFTQTSASQLAATLTHLPVPLR